MIRNLLLAVAAAAIVLPVAEVGPYAAGVAHSAPMPAMATLYIGKSFDGGMHYYADYYVERALERSRLDHDVTLWKLRGWAVYVKYR